jgi:signal peptidase I
VVVRRKAALGLALVVGSLAGCGGTTFRVPSASMLPTLKVGQRVGVDTGAFSERAPRIGQIIVAHVSEQASSSTGENLCVNPRQGRPGGQPCAIPGRGPTNVSFIKRVVGLPGDRIAVVKGQVVRNGAPLHEPYARACNDPICNFPKPITVPAQTYFVLGDNRPESEDSRSWGPIPRSWIVGLAGPGLKVA